MAGSWTQFPSTVAFQSLQENLFLLSRGQLVFFPWKQSKRNWELLIEVPPPPKLLVSYLNSLKVGHWGLSEPLHSWPCPHSPHSPHSQSPKHVRSPACAFRGTGHPSALPGQLRAVALGWKHTRGCARACSTMKLCKYKVGSRGGQEAPPVNLERQSGSEEVTKWHSLAVVSG